MAQPPRPLRIGTRGSPLALAQAAMVRDALASAHGWDPDELAIVPLRTTGDRIQDRPLADVGGKALWTRELDRALMAGEIDLAVHSMKDVETIRPPEIRIAAMLPRADARDRLVGAESLAALPAGARVGTASPRRAAQVLRARPDARILLFRGNVDTRLAKLAAGEADATLLAAAGLDRLGRDVGHPLSLEAMLPAPAQGAVGIEVAADRSDLLPLLSAIGDAATEAAVGTERAFLLALGADCHSPIAAHAQVTGDRLTLAAELLTPDGRLWVEGSAEASVAEGEPMAADLARALLGRADLVLAALFAPPR